MKLAGLEQSDGTISTGFADELETPLWQQPYLAAAYQSGMISGTPTEEGLVFRPEEDLSRAEAAVMLQKLLRLPGDAAVFAPDEASAIPAWAQSAVSALSNAGIPLAASDYEAPLTRREAANMLLAAAPAAEAFRQTGTEAPAESSPHRSTHSALPVYRRYSPAPEMPCGFSAFQRGLYKI